MQLTYDQDRKLVLPDRLFGRIYQPRVLPELGRMKTMWQPGLPPPPPTYSLDKAIAAAVPGLVIPMRVYLNDALGDCVMAARANQQTIAYAFGSKAILAIQDPEVRAEYFAETGGQDTGLVPETSLGLWQSQGWLAGGSRHFTKTWGRVDATDQVDVKLAIAHLYGCQFSFEMPLAWQDATNNGQPWDAPTAAQLSDPRWQLGSWGGHQVLGRDYNEIGPLVDSWGLLIQLTWAGLAWAGNESNQGEAECVVVAADAGALIDVTTLQEEQQAIQEAA